MISHLLKLRGHHTPTIESEVPDPNVAESSSSITVHRISNSVHRGTAKLTFQPFNHLPPLSQPLDHLVCTQTFRFLPLFVIVRLGQAPQGECDLEDSYQFVDRALKFA